jgi:LPS sulfotransferase NodH
MSPIDQPFNANRQVDGARFFLLVGSQRCGSNFLREVLVTHPHAAVQGEIFYPYPLPNCFHSFVRSVATRPMPPQFYEDAVGLMDDYLVFLREDSKRSFPAKAGSIAAIGLDVKYNQMRFLSPVHHDLGARPILFDYCAARGIPILHLVRTNVIHQALSLVLAETRNAYHRFGSASTQSGPVEVSLPRLLECARWVESETGTFRKMAKGMKVLEVSYERVAGACARSVPGDKLGPSVRVMAEIAEFLGLASEFSNPTTIQKMIDRPYRELVSNYEEMKAGIRSSEFEPFLESI